MAEGRDNPLGRRKADHELRKFLRVLTAFCVALFLYVSVISVVAFTNAVSRVELRESSYTNDLHACQRANGTRRTWNRATPALQQTAENLERLSHRLALTRRLEARFFFEVAAAGDPGDAEKVKPLIDIYRGAAAFDRRVRRSQQRFEVRPFQIVPCVELVEKP